MEFKTAQTKDPSAGCRLLAVGPERKSWGSAQRPRQMFIRVPIMPVGRCEMIWDMDVTSIEYTRKSGVGTK